MRFSRLTLMTAASLLSSQLLAQAPVFDATRPPAQEPARTQAASSSPQEEIYYQLQQLQREVMELRGQVEEQGYQLQQLKQQSLDRYIDLDRRIGAAGGTPAAPAEPSRPTAAAPVAGGEAGDYRRAYELVKSQQFAAAIPAFKGFVERYPAGTYTANAWYWLGELYLVSKPQDLAASEQAFKALLDGYPEHGKVPDAMYKLGKVYYLQGKRDRARQLLNRVVAEHGSSGAAKLAGQFLRESF